MADPVHPVTSLSPAAEPERLAGYVMARARVVAAEKQMYVPLSVEATGDEIVRIQERSGVIRPLRKPVPQPFLDPGVHPQVVPQHDHLALVLK